jgi:hypothetical protein
MRHLRYVIGGLVLVIAVVAICVLAKPGTSWGDEPKPIGVPISMTGPPFLLIDAPVPPQAAKPKTGADALDMCDLRTVGAEPLCLSFIEGVVDQMRGTPKEFCLQEGVPLGHLRIMVALYLDSHPELLKLSALGAIIEAIHSDYPCQEVAN